MMKMDPDMMVYSLWVLTVIGVLAGLTMAVAAAVFAVINSAITPISALAGIPGLYFWNISASKRSFVHLLFSFFAYIFMVSSVFPTVSWQSMGSPVFSKTAIQCDEQRRSTE